LVVGPLTPDRARELATYLVTAAEAIDGKRV
jgi:hypothetical protein